MIYDFVLIKENEILMDEPVFILDTRNSNPDLNFAYALLFNRLKREPTESEIEEFYISEMDCRIYENDRKWIYSQFINKRFKLMRHQVLAIKWMRKIEGIDCREAMKAWPIDNRGVRGGILSLEMGLGKSLCTIAHSLFSPRSDNAWPDLIVCGKSLLYEWQAQFSEAFGEIYEEYDNNRGYTKKYYGECRIPVLFYHKDIIGTKAFNELSRDELKKYRFVVTTYEVLVGAISNVPDTSKVCVDKRGRSTNVIINVNHKTSDPGQEKRGSPLLFYVPWERITTDESHIFSNPDTRRFRAVMRVPATFRWCLTGTPIRNGEADVCSLFRFLGYTSTTFQGKHMVYLDWFAILRREFFERFIFRMSTIDAGIRLPRKIINHVDIKMSGKHLEVYRVFEENARKVYAQFSRGENSYMSIFAEIMRLRQICIAPYMILPDSKRNSDNVDYVIHTKMIKKIIKRPELLNWLYYKEGESGITSSKISQVVKIVKSVEKDDKILIFSSFTSCLDLVVAALKKSIPYQRFVMIDGSTSGDDREKALYNFRTDPNVQVFLSTYKVCSEGLNLTQANHVILMDAWWTFAVEDQAIARAYRMGQQRQVHVHTLRTCNGIEKALVQMRADEKRKKANEFLQGSIASVPSGSGKLSKNIMEKLLYKL